MIDTTSTLTTVILKTRNTITATNEIFAKEIFTDSQIEFSF